MTRRRFVPVILALALAGQARCLADDPAGAPATARSLCDALIGAMKKGPSMTFAAREELLGPEIRRDLDLALMTRIIVGPAWRSLAQQDKQDLIDSFSEYSVASYAQRFKSFSGERFEVDPVASSQPNGDCIVGTRLYTGDPDPVQLNYLMRQGDGRWRIIDVFLSGTISELAARRSEYSLVLRQGGAQALVALLRKKAVELGN
jgi:phospholipid transport system substrate-binding protein